MTPHTSESTESPLQEQPQYSLNYPRSNGGDLVLLSSDGQRFCVRKAVLAASSLPFAHMLDLGTSQSESEIQEVELEETRAVLETILPYTQPHPVEPFVLEFPGTFSVLKAMDKYGIWRGLDAIRLAFCHSYMGINGSLDGSKITFEQDVYAYLFATHVADARLREVAFKRLVDAEPTVEELLQMSEKLQNYFKGDTSRELVHLTD